MDADRETQSSSSLPAVSPPARQHILAPKRKACLPCTKAKRKCDKHVPCRRCLEKGCICQYPSPKRIFPVYSQSREDQALQACKPAPSSTSPTRATNSLTVSGHDGFADALSSPGSSEPDSSGLTSLEGPWYLSPESWIVKDAPSTAGPLPEPCYYNDGALPQFIHEVQNWLEQWVSEGYNPFIHPHLYQNSMAIPNAIKDVYTSVTAYHAKNTANHSMTLRILQDRADSLVAAQARASLDASFDIVLLDTFDHLVRVQALLIYQLLRLFDGDIRARAQAEQHIPILDTWTQQMWSSACLDIGSAAAATGMTSVPLEAPLANADGIGISASANSGFARTPAIPGTTFSFKTDGTVASKWQAWILAESVRRTFLVAHLIQSVYRTLRDGYSQCSGCIDFTSRTGAWEAKSPHAWLKALSGRTSPRLPNTADNAQAAKRQGRIDMSDMMQPEKIFREESPQTVDSFTHAILMLSVGLERLEAWTCEKRSPGMTA